MTKKVKKHVSFDEDVLEAVKKEAEKERMKVSPFINKTMADRLKVKR